VRANPFCVPPRVQEAGERGRGHGRQHGSYRFLARPPARPPEPADDGGGAFAAWHAVRLLQRLGVKPARTIRAVLWTNEENGAAGGKGYARDYAATLNFTSLAIEADEGPFTPFQLAFSGHPAAQRQLQVLAPLLAPIGAGNVSSRKWCGEAARTGARRTDSFCAARRRCLPVLLLPT
jgi:hypothetical protein